MCDRIIYAVVLIFAILMASVRPSGAQVQKWCNNSGADNTTSIDIWTIGKPKGFWYRPCHDEECRATKDLGCAVTAFGHLAVANTMGYISPEAMLQAQAVYQGNVDAVGREHPARIPLYCKLLTRVAATLTGRWPTDSETAWQISQLGKQIERPGRPSCVDRLIAATPPEADTIKRRMRLCQHHRAC